MCRGLRGVSLFLRSYACSYCRVSEVCFSLCVFARGSIKILQFKERMLAFRQDQGDDEGQPTRIFQPTVTYLQCASRPPVVEIK